MWQRFRYPIEVLTEVNTISIVILQFVEHNHINNYRHNYTACIIKEKGDKIGMGYMKLGLGHAATEVHRLSRARARECCN